MVEYQAASTDDGKLGLSIPSSAHWHRFWYNLKTYVHASWMMPEQGLLIDNRVLKETSSQQLWKNAYPILCHQFSLAKDFNPKKPANVFWQEFLPLLSLQPSRALKLAGMAYFASDSVYYLDAQKEKNEYRQAIQLGRSLSLQARCHVPVKNNSIEAAGLSLLFQICQLSCESYWPRARLAFAKESVLQIEAEASVQSLSEASLRCLHRLWKMINHILSTDEVVT